ncbi:hypothetical protein LX32DRAFT_691912 [Colletotrichum zoysiae]|uniref:Uncharacterized protein n=1 Tax=Colletotrichum zoysiae TaxID=1216348 RepID=A0AAD9HMV5_9PEZI|nr:hypothetical protein LX32DRAFT_691912 [Colletotrichum zoysiae]
MSRNKEFPAWYYRVKRLYDRSEDAVIKPHYFDKDISDLESESGSDDAAQNDGAPECNRGDDGDCQCQPGEDMSDYADCADYESERSFDGSEASFYYELKEAREERKRELRHMAKERQEAMERDGREEEKVRLAYEALGRAEEEGEALYMGSLAGKYFRLHSVDYIKHCSPLLFLSKRVEFTRPESESPGRRAAPGDRRVVEGHIRLAGSTNCFTVPFRSPARPSRRKRVIKSSDGGHDLVFQFIGDEHLILRLSRELLFEGRGGPVPASVPETFVFMGVLADRDKEWELWNKRDREDEEKREREKREALEREQRMWREWEERVRRDREKLEREKRERLEREERERRERAEREPSPRETWFELNHPMGAFYEENRYYS